MSFAVYNPVLYSVKCDSGCSDSFTSTVGVKQGCVLSPTLFNIFLHDLPLIFDQKCEPVTLHDIKLNCILYADDLVILSESEVGLQNALNRLSDYCAKWKLTVNLSKTKVIIFNKRGHTLKKYRFVYNNSMIEIVPSYCYLGIVFTASGTFKAATDRLAEQAQKAAFKLKQLNIRDNVILAFKLFECLIFPILSYGSEVWSPFTIHGINNSNFMTLCDKPTVEKVLIKFCKYMLGVNKKACNAAVRAELGQFPVLTNLLIHSAKYWFHVGNLDPSSLAHKAFLQADSTPSLPNWGTLMKKLWRNFGFENVSNNCNNMQNNKKFLKLLKQAICTNYISNWSHYLNRSECDSVNQGNKLRCYNKFKSEFKMENYVLQTKCDKRREFAKLRISAHTLQIELGRYAVPKVPACERFCKLCNTNSVEDETHFIMSCINYSQERDLLFNNLNSYTNFNNLDEIGKFKFIMSYNGGDVEILNHVLTFVNSAIEKRNICLSSCN